MFKFKACTLLDVMISKKKGENGEVYAEKQIFVKQDERIIKRSLKAYNGIESQFKKFIYFSYRRNYKIFDLLKILALEKVERKRTGISCV